MTLFITLGALVIVAVNLTKRPGSTTFVSNLPAPSIPATGSQPIAQSNLEARFQEFEAKLEKAAADLAGTAALVGSASRGVEARRMEWEVYAGHGLIRCKP